jgi:hypothetical protein
VALYGTQYLVNLVNSNGREKHVKEAYERSLQESKLLEGRDVNYQYFDYHTECSHMRHEKISLLIDKLHDGLISGGYVAKFIPLETDIEPPEHTGTSIKICRNLPLSRCKLR